MEAKGETKLSKLIKNMEPHLNKGEYVFATLKNIDKIPRELTICEFKETEGTTVVIERYQADKLNLSYNFIASWITLRIHSSLEAVGLTAAFSKALAEEDISCNVVAGFYHDHLFVPCEQANKAIEILKAFQ